jgi:hypothetical protein
LLDFDDMTSSSQSSSGAATPAQKVGRANPVGGRPGLGEKELVGRKQERGRQFMPPAQCIGHSFERGCGATLFSVVAPQVLPQLWLQPSHDPSSHAHWSHAHPPPVQQAHAGAHPSQQPAAPVVPDPRNRPAVVNAAAARETRDAKPTNARRFIFMTPCGG